ncbi:MAG: hypothetical protein WBG76_13805 [Ornithinimicrobium sp.]
MEYAVSPVRDLLEQGWARAKIDQLPRPDDAYGLRVVSGLEVGRSREARIHNALAGAPHDGVLSGWAAASLLGVAESFLDGTSDGSQPLPVDFSVGRVVGRYRRSGLRIRRSPVPREDQVTLDGVTMTSHNRTALDLARWARWEPRALAMLDLCYRHDLIGPADFGEYLAPLKRLHGLKLARATAPLMTDRAESPQESELRHLWSTLDLPRPIANPRVFDRYGCFVARIDLLDPESGFGAEYQGYWHLLDGAAEEDEVRLTRLRRMNLTIVPVWKSDMASRDVVGKLRAAHRLAKARDPRLDAWTCRL